MSCEEIEKTQREYLWNDTHEKHKYHLVKCDQVCKSRANGELVSVVTAVNKLGKLLRQIGDNAQGCVAGC